MPTYNRGSIIERAVDSVCAQSYPHWGLIIVDDGSTDDTAARIQAYLPDPRIHYYSEEENHGHLYARNRAWDRISARTDWIVHLDSDDELLPNALETIHATIQKSPGFEWYHFGVRWDHGAVASLDAQEGFVGSYEGRLLQRDPQGEWAQVLHRNIIDEGYRFREACRDHPSTALWLRLARSKPVYYSTKIVRIQNSRSVSVTRPVRKDARFYRRRVERLRIFFSEFGSDLQRLDAAAYERKWAKYVRAVARSSERRDALRLWWEGIQRKPLCSEHWLALVSLLGGALRAH